ncbi:MAG: hypothetical protein IJ875_05955 [Solobacterium sp.]|nr:hypothetical protein [Solobacterium sp.]
MSQYRNRSLDEIILDENISVSDPQLYYDLAQCFKDGLGVEAHAGLFRLFERMAKEAEEKRLARVEDKIIHVIKDEEDEFVPLGEEVIPVFDEDEFPEFFLDEKTRFILDMDREKELSSSDVVKEMDEDTLSYRERYLKAKEMMLHGSYDDGLELMKKLAMEENIDEKTKAQVYFVLALACPAERYSREAVFLAWRHREEEYAKQFLEYYYHLNPDQSLVDDKVILNEEDDSWKESLIAKEEEKKEEESFVHKPYEGIPESIRDKLPEREPLGEIRLVLNAEDELNQKDDLDDILHRDVVELYKKIEQLQGFLK